jgi:protein N-terminal methyltransferase
MIDNIDNLPADASICKEDGLRYWEGIQPDDNGMLGGFAYISKVDLQSSRNFLAKLGIGRAGKGLRSVENALEGGAGYVFFFSQCFFYVVIPIQPPPPPFFFHKNCILRKYHRIGRITTNLLATLATEIDIIEPISKFTAVLHGKDGVRTIYNCGLESWQPDESAKYDLVWTQWCVGHLTDRQLVEYLERCRDALAEDGLIVIKENLSTSGRDAFDEEDSSVTRYVSA